MLIFILFLEVNLDPSNNICLWYRKQSSILLKNKKRAPLLKKDIVDQDFKPIVFYQKKKSKPLSLFKKKEQMAFFDFSETVQISSIESSATSYL